MPVWNPDGFNNIAAGTQTADRNATVVFQDGGNVTFGMNNNTITANVVAGGADGFNRIVAGTQTAATFTTVVFSDSHNVTFGMSGSSRVTASASFPAETPFGLSAGTQSVSTGTLVFSDSHNVTFGMSGSSRITASASFAQTVQTQNLVAVTLDGNTAGALALISSGTFTLAGGNNITVSQAGNAVTISGAAGGAGDGLNRIVAGTQTAGTLATVVFSDSHNVTFGMSGSTRVTASASFPAETPFGLSAGTQSVSTGTLVFSDSHNVTFGMSGSSRVTASASFPAETPFGVSAGTQSVSTGTLVFSNSHNVTFGMSGSSRVTASASFAAETPFGVSAGTQSVSTGTLVFSDSHNVTFGMSGSSRVTASASFNQSVQPVVGGFGASNTGNTAGNTGTSTGTWVLAGSTNVTVSESTGAAGVHTLWLSAPNAGAGGAVNFSAGTTSGDLASVVFSNSNGVSFGLNGSTITAKMPTVSWLEANVMPTQGLAIVQTTASIQRMFVPFQISATRVDWIAFATASTAAVVRNTISFGVYTMSGSTASRASTATREISWGLGTTTSNTTAYGGNSGTRYRSLALGTWNLTPGEYLIYFNMSTSSSQTAGTWSNYGQSGISLVGTAGGGNLAEYWGQCGQFASNAFPASIHVTAITRTGASAFVQPWFQLAGSF